MDTIKEFSLTPVLHVHAVAHGRLGELEVFVQSWINQTSSNWVLDVVHDGPNSEFEEVMEKYKNAAPNKIYYETTAQRYNDFGHSLRDAATRSIRADYILLTNADNYYIPKALEYISAALQSNPDIVMFDMVHSHKNPGMRPLPAYSFFETSYKRGSIDVGAAVVRSHFAKLVGFRDKSHDGDATYFEDILKLSGPEGLRVSKIERILFVHN